jgi:hypothetical protein
MGEVGRKWDDNREMDGLQAMLRIRIAFMRIQIIHSAADPDHIFDLMRIRIPPLTFFPIWTLSMLQNDPLRLPPCHFDADPNPAFYFDADPDPDPASQNNVDPDPQHGLQERWLAK